jgi:cephalosporin hydroxylase
MAPYEQFKAECDNEIALQNNPELWKKTHDWMFADNMRHYSYHFEWLGRPIIQYPQDIVQFQEIVWQTKPDLIIETGIAHGGSLVLSASMLALLDMLITPQKNRMVLGIDIDIRKHNKETIEAHPLANRIKMLEGSSIDENIVNEVRKYAKDFQSIMVCLDSNHTHDHVLQELKLYAPLVSIGNYCIVWDTVVEDMPEGSCNDRPWGKGNNPKTAVWEFLKTHTEFEIDRDIQNKLLITVAPEGYLRRVR